MPRDEDGNVTRFTLHKPKEADGLPASTRPSGSHEIPAIRFGNATTTAPRTYAFSVGYREGAKRLSNADHAPHCKACRPARQKTRDLRKPRPSPQQRSAQPQRNNRAHNQHYHPLEVQLEVLRACATASHTKIPVATSMMSTSHQRLGCLWSASGSLPPTTAATFSLSSS